MYQKQIGFSLIEYLMAMVLLCSILLAGHFVLQDFLIRQERTIFLSALKDSLEFARSEAFFRNKTITLCGSHSKQRCHRDKDWSTGFIVFENKDQGMEVTPGSILRRVSGTKYGRIQFTGVHPHIHVPPRGLSMNIGSFLYCAKDSERTKQELDGLVINRALRSYYLRENSEKLAQTHCKE